MELQANERITTKDFAKEYAERNDMSIAKSNEIVLGSDEEVYSDRLTANKMNWMSIGGIGAGETLRARAKIRYSHKGEYCTVKSCGEEGIKVCFDKPVRAATPGQAVVFYDEEGYVIGGASITGVGK